MTEDSVALELVERFTGQLRFCHTTEAWFAWDGAAWRQNRTEIGFQLARELAREQFEKEDQTAKVADGKAGFAFGVERLARVDPHFAVTSEEWDADSFLLGTPDGTVDLRTGQLRPARQADGITKLTAVGPAEHAVCPQWLKFLNEATSGDTELIRFLQQWFDYCLTGHTREHALLFIFGPGGNGKSVALNVLTRIMRDHAAVAAMETFSASQLDRHPADLAALRGARLVTSSETEAGRAWAETRIKAMTGGDPITARFMRQNFFTYQPNFKLLIVGNHQPSLRNVDEAARRRFNIVPFTVKPKNPDRQLEAKLETEWPSILRWMIDGCLDWQTNGLIRPESVVAATAQYFEEQDRFGQWIEAECERDDAPHIWDLTSNLFESWFAHARAAGGILAAPRPLAPPCR